MKKLTLILITLIAFTAIIYANSYPRARAVISDQMNVGSKAEVEKAIILMGFCQHYTVTDITDGYNVACINVYAGE